MIDRRAERDGIRLHDWLMLRVSVVELTLDDHQERVAFLSRDWILHCRIFLKSVVDDCLSERLLEEGESAFLMVVSVFFKSYKVPFDCVL